MLFDNEPYSYSWIKKAKLFHEKKNYLALPISPSQLVGWRFFPVSQFRQAQFILRPQPLSMNLFLSFAGRNS
jgi:hypothetical protein